MKGSLFSKTTVKQTCDVTGGYVGANGLPVEKRKEKQINETAEMSSHFSRMENK